MSSYNVALVESMVANGPVASREKNETLYPRVVAGDKAACAEMIESNMSLVIDKVDSYLRAFPDLAYLRDDLISEGFLGLVYAVNEKMVGSTPRNEKKAPSATGYMSHWISFYIGILADSQTGMGCCSKTVRRLRQDGKPLPQHVPLPKNYDMETYEDPAIRVFELRDEILACCESDEDRVIVEMREKGYGDPEIAKTLDLPHCTVFIMRRELYARFLAKTGMKGEV
jgi:hypothetical protein